MSIQLKVCTPWYYLRSKQASDDFVEKVKDKVGCQVDNMENIASWSFDLPISAFDEIDDLFYEENGDCIERDIFLTGLILPCKFDGMYEIDIPNEDEISIVSYELFTNVLDKYESLIRKKINDHNNLDNYLYFINAYRNAINECLKNKQIIYLEA